MQLRQKINVVGPHMYAWQTNIAMQAHEKWIWMGAFPIHIHFSH